MLHKLYLALLTSLLCIDLQSCTTHVLIPHQYVMYVTDSANGLRKTIRHEKVYFTVQYQPVDYLNLLDATGNTVVGGLNRQQRKFDGLQHFAFSIGSNDHQSDPIKIVKNEMSYEDAILYYAFDAIKDFSIVYSDDTFPCVIHHFEQSNGLRPRIDLLLGFNEKAFSNSGDHVEITLLFYDRIYGTGANAFTFHKEDLLHLPEIHKSSL